MGEEEEKEREADGHRWMLLSSHEVNKSLSFLVGQHRRDSLLP